MISNKSQMSGITGLSKRILFYILICSSSVTLILTGLELYFEYRIDVNLLEQRFKSIEVSYLPSLSENIWLFNTDVVESQIRGIYNLNDVIYVSIVDETNTIVNAIGDKQAKHIISQTYPIVREQQGTINQLGHIEVWATLDNIYASLRNRLAVILLGQGVKTFLVSFLILLIIFKIITSRVSRISQLVSSIDLSDNQEHQTELSVHKAIARPNKPHDELDELAQTIDSMHGKVRQLYVQSDEQRRKLSTIFEGSHDAILIIDLTNNSVIDFNSKACDMLNFSAEQLRNLSFYALYSGTHNHIRNFLDDTQRTGWNIKELTFKSRLGNLIPTETSASIIEINDQPHLLTICRDIRERKQHEAKIDKITNFDQLTSLPNRVLMRDRINQTIIRNQSTPNRYAIMIIDIDNFKSINDTLGQGNGDLLIKATANIIQSIVPKSDSLGRLSSDEFLLLAELPESDISIARKITAKLAEQIRQAFDETMLVAGSLIKVSVSIGCAMLGDDGKSFDELLRHTDLALCKAKADGRDRVVFFSPGMDAEANQKLILKTALHRALKAKEFVLFYQPIIDLDTRQTVSVECLLRWQTPDGNMISPAEFIPELVSSGLILDVGAWVIEEACSNMAKLDEQVPIAVNVSPCQLESDDIIIHVEQVLNETGLAPEMLVIEVTEDLIIQDKGWAIERLNRLSKMGVKIALDDFGTGYSSLSYLKILPVDKLKIDQSFVRDMLTDPEDSAIVATIISIAKTLKLDLIAEGVETELQAQHLRHLGCAKAQGYLYQKPQGNLTKSIHYREDKLEKISGL